MKSIALALVSGLALVAGIAHADAPGSVRIRNVSYAGTGCPAGSVAENLASDYHAFTLLFDSYIAEVGPGIPLSESRRNCQVLVDLDFPNGWSYSILTVDYRGYISLDGGVSAVQKSAYYFQGQSQTASLQTTMTGPRDEDYQIRDTLGLEAVVWSPCGAQRALNINTQVRTDNGRNRNARGLITLDSIDGEIQHIYGLRWRRC